MSKLYLRRQGGRYSEQHVVRGNATVVGDNVRSRFELAPTPELVAVRFDPAAETGIYSILDVRWRDARSGAELLRCVPTASAAGVGATGGVRLPQPPDVPLAFWAIDQDPYLELIWPAEIRARQTAVTLDVEWHHEPMGDDEAVAMGMQLLDADREQLLAGLSATERRLASQAIEANERSLAQIDVERRVGEAEYHLAKLTVEHERLSGDLFALGESASQRLDERARELEAAFDARLQDIAQRHAAEREDFERQLRDADAARESVAAAGAQLRTELDALREEWQTPLWRRAWRRLRSGSPLVRRNLVAAVDPLRVRRFTVRPLGDVEAATAADGTAIWRASGADPRFLLEPRGAGVPSSGWYVLTTTLTLHDTPALVEPSLYVDYGGGMSEVDKIALRVDPQRSRQRVLVKLTGDARALRFDPSTQACAFAIGDVRLRKLSSFEAALRLAQPTLVQLWRSPRHLKIAFGDAFKAWRAGGVAEVERRLRALHENRQRDVGYANWVARFDTLDDADRSALAAAVQRLPRRPTISILVPVYNTPERWLRRCIDSVLEQAYPDWQLCIADDASTQPHVRRVLEEYAARDTRIRLALRESNGHIAAASNSALALADGEYVALLDHDDELRPHALYLVAERLARDPDLCLVYSDEDKIDEHGRRYDPYFKPDWNPQLFYSQNYVSHLGVYRADLVRDAGGFRVGFEGSQDYDLALRCIERLRPEQIGHIPHVLYHWRSVAGSTALAGSEKNYTHDASQRALREHFARIGEAAVVETTPQGYFRSRYLLPDPAPMVSLIVPTRDKVELLRMCVDGLLGRTDYPSLEVLIVDNQSSEPATLTYFASLADEPRVRVVPYDRPFNFSAINNYAAAQARGDIVGLINNDIEVIEPGWLKELVAYASRADVGAAGAKLYYPDDRIQHAGVVVGFGGVAGHSYQRFPRSHPGQMNRANLVQNVSSVTAACLLLRREVYEKIGGLDEGLSVAFNDIDFCLRILDLGLRIVWTPYAELYHHESASRGYEDSPEKLARFQREIRFMQQRWGDRLLADPAYNPNLALEGEPFDLAWPPRARYPFRPSEG